MESSVTHKAGPRPLTQVPRSGGSKADKVYQWLRANIADGRLLPKDRVNADLVSRELVMSKIPVREAIARLVAEGALVLHPNAGAVVTPLSWRELADIQQARLMLEPPMARLAARDPSPEALATLRRNNDELRTWAQTHNGDPYALIRSFHLSLMTMAGNELVVTLVDGVLQRVSRYRVLAKHTSESGLSNAEEHEQIVEALSAGEADQAEALLAEHLQSEHTVAADARAVDLRYFADSSGLEDR